MRGREEKVCGKLQGGEETDFARGIQLDRATSVNRVSNVLQDRTGAHLIVKRTSERTNSRASNLHQTVERTKERGYTNFEVFDSFYRGSLLQATD